MAKEKHKHKIIISCEHGGNHVPTEYRALFRGRRALLQSHRGLDCGALELARRLAAAINAPLFFSKTTRLLVDLNRSLHHPGLFSELTRGCSRKVKTEILAGHYHPYRNKLETAVRKHLAADDTVIHLSIHSFTPRLDGAIRRADVGLLYDPQRRGERDLCRTLRNALREQDPALMVRLNYPYRGTADGFTTHLRRKYHGHTYLGIEIEINQKHVAGDRAQWLRLQRQVAAAVAQAVR